MALVTLDQKGMEELTSSDIPPGGKINLFTDGMSIYAVDAIGRVFQWQAGPLYYTVGEGYPQG